MHVLVQLWIGTRTNQSLVGPLLGLMHSSSGGQQGAPLGRFWSWWAGPIRTRSSRSELVLTQPGRDSEPREVGAAVRVRWTGTRGGLLTEAVCLFAAEPDHGDFI